MLAIIWTKNKCPYCDWAKEELKLLGIEYEERNLDKDWTKSQLLEMVPAARTVPQIFIDNKYVGGYTDLVGYLNSL